MRGLGWLKTPDIHVDGPPTLLTGDQTGPTRTANGVTIPGGMSLNLILSEFLGKGTVFKHYGLGVLNFVEGVATNLALHADVLADPEFTAGGVDTAYLPRLLQRRVAAAVKHG